MAQLNISIVVPDDKAQDILVTLTDRLGYEGQGTRAEFLRVYVRNYLKELYINSKRIKAQQDATTLSDTSAGGVDFQ